MTGIMFYYFKCSPKKALNVFRVICNFLKNTPEYIDPTGQFVIYEILCSSNFYGRTSPR